MAVDPVAANLAPQISGAIRQAARSTGVSFEYLVTTARIESNFNPAAQAPTSSAKGLYQFIEQTWLATVKKEGPALGLGRYADAIVPTGDGRYEVPDAKARAAIMQLRSDPNVSALMAGAFSRNNAFHLTGAIGRRPTEGELYTAHFLGSDGAGKLINAAEQRPGANAAAMFPQAAAANRSIFYDGGRSRSVGEVYARLTGLFDKARVAALGVAAPVAEPSAVVATAAPATTAAAPGHFVTAPSRPPDTAGVTQAFADAHDRLPPLPDTKPLFQAMFTDRAQAALTKTVSGLWSSSAAGPGDRQVRPLELFTDGATDTRKLFGDKA